MPPPLAGRARVQSTCSSYNLCSIGEDEVASASAASTSLLTSLSPGPGNHHSLVAHASAAARSLFGTASSLLPRSALASGSVSDSDFVCAASASSTSSAPGATARSLSSSPGHRPRPASRRPRNRSVAINALRAGFQGGRLHKQHNATSDSNYFDLKIF